MMPQWEFLNFIAATAKNYPSFHLMMQAEAIGLTDDGALKIAYV